MNGHDFQVTIVSAAPSTAGEPADREPFAVEHHSKGAGKVIERIEALTGIWDQVIAKLTGLVEKSQNAASASNFEMSSIEFNVGIEAGLSVGLVTKGEASVAVTFTRKKDAGVAG